MGMSLDALCRPKGTSTDTVALSFGDLYYDPIYPDKILCYQGADSNPLVDSTLENNDDVINLSTGLKYKYQDNLLILEEFCFQNTTYYISGIIESEDITVASNCVLKFTGGLIIGKLHGDQTTIEAKRTQIFGEQTDLAGTFTNDCAYPEWWGALPNIMNLKALTASTVHKNCAPAIQRAFDSPISEVRFHHGLYYVASSDANEDSILILKRCKRITMRGQLRKSHDAYHNGMDSSVIWTDQDKNVIEITLIKIIEEPKPDGTQEDKLLEKPTNFFITGGEINVSRCFNFTHAAILIHPTAINGCLLTTTLVGPIDGYSYQQQMIQDVYNKDVLAYPINWEGDEENNKPNYVAAANEIFHQNYDASNFREHLDDLLDNGFLGYGIKITDRGIAETLYGTNRGYMYFATFRSCIYGFGHGIYISYNNTYCVVTSSEFNCTLEQCFRYVYAPSKAFGGGILEGRIQTTYINRPENYDGPIIYGNFSNAFINPFIWDVATGINMIELTETSVDVRFGQRVLTATKKSNHAAYMQEQRYAQVIGGLTCYRGWHQGARTMARILHSDNSAFLGGLGNFDMGAIPVHNIKTQSSNYVHLIDNDLLALDLIDNGIITLVNGISAKDFSDYYEHIPGEFSQVDQKRKCALVNDLFRHIDVKSWSAFNREGFKIFFKDNFTDYYPPVINHDGEIIGRGAKTVGKGGDIAIDIIFPTNNKVAVNGNFHLLFIALHLKSDIFPFYSRLKFTVTCSEAGNTEVFELYNGSYHDAVTDDKLKDIVLPFLFHTGDRYMHPLSMRLEFSELQKTGMTWSNETSFGFLIEGRANRHFNHNIFTSSGGALGGDITRQGLPYIFGNRTYTRISDLPTAVSDGAMAVVNHYPTIMTPQGWMIQHLVGTIGNISQLNYSMGPISIGQEAYITDYHLRANWTGSQWLFDKLVVTIQQLNELHELLGFFAEGQLAYVSDLNLELRFSVGRGWIDTDTGYEIDFPDE